MNGEVCPISQTNEFGVSLTMPQPSAFPSCCLSNAGMSGPSLFEFRTIVPWPPLARSVTVTWNPSLSAVVYQCTVMVSPACMTSGCVDNGGESIALNAAGSDFLTTLHTGEHTV